MIKFISILLITTLANAQSDEQSLQQWTEKNETQLKNKYQQINSSWFELKCLSLAKKMQFTTLSSCRVFDSEIINAYVFNNGHVYFSKGMMLQIKNQHQWAAILAHENAHVELQHYLKTMRKIKKPGIFFPKSKIRKILRKHESQADDWSKQRSKEYGFDYSQISYFLKRAKNLKNGKNNKQHLKLANRIEKSDAVEIIDEELIKKIEELKLEV